MKRVIALVLCALLCVGALVGCGSEGGDSHVHTFDYSKWSYDANGHWFNATCDCEVVTEEKLKHVDENLDGACDACKYVYECKDGHTYSAEWAADCTNHWQVADCGHITAPANLAEHADASGDGVCDTCGYVINDLHTHYYDSAWTSDAEYHWHKALCEHNVEITDKAAHTLNAAGYCTVCEAKVVEISKTDIAAIIAAAVAQNDKVVNGNVIAFEAFFDLDGDTVFLSNAMTSEIYYVIGESDTYVIEKNYNLYDEFIGADEYWYETVGYDADGNAIVECVGKTYGEFDLSPFAGDARHLNGYNYIPGTILPSDSDDTSTLANLIYGLYGLKAAGVNVSNASEAYDAETGVYTFAFTYFTVNASNLGDEIHYSVHDFDVSVEFTVDELGVINNATILVDSYRNFEAGAQSDIDLDYDPVTNTVTRRQNATPTCYYYAVSQRSGERTFTTPYPVAALIPVDFELYDGKGDWNDDVPPSLVITEYEKIEDSVTYTEGDTVRIFLDNLSPMSSSAKFLNISDFVITAVNKDATSEGALYTTEPYYSRDYGFIGFAAKDAGEYEFTIKYGDIVKTFTVIVEEFQVDVGEVEDNQFVVITTDTYAWEVDEYVFESKGEGAYTLYLPAGLGLWKKGASAPAVDFYSNENGATVNIELEADDTYTFYYAATTRGAWTITYAYVACEVENGDGDVAVDDGPATGSATLAVGSNSFVFTDEEIAQGYAERALTVTEAGAYKFAGDVLIASVTSSEGVPAVYENYAYTLAAGEYVVRVTVFYNEAGVSYSLRIENTSEGGDVGGGDVGGDDPAPSLPVLSIGQNTITFEAADIENGKDYALVVTEEGTFTVRGDLLAIFLDSEGIQISRGQAYLVAGTYTVKFVNIMATEGSFDITLEYEAPAGESGGEGTEADPFVWAELPDSVTIESDTVNMIYYLYTATENGTLTLTWVSGDSWGNWFEMDGSNTTANNGSASRGEVMSFTVEAGKTYRIGLGTYYNAGEFVINVDFTAGSGSEGGDVGGGDVGGDDSIVIKQPVYDDENEIEVNADDLAAGKFYVTYEAWYEGEYYISSGDLFVTSVIAADGTVLSRNDNGYFELLADNVYTVEISTQFISNEGTYKLAVEYQYPEGHQNNPYWIYDLSEEVTATYKGDYMPVWYQFYASETGILTVNATSADATILVCAVIGRELSGEGTISMPVVKDRVYYIGVADYTAPEAIVDITFSASIEAGEIVTDGSANVPHDIVLGENTASIFYGDVVYFAYKFPSEGTLTLTTDSAVVSWFLSTDLSKYVESVTDSAITISGYMDETVYLGISTSDWSSADIVFTASAKLAPTYVNYENEVITDGSAANELVIEDNTYVYLSFNAMGSYVITWDNADASVYTVSWMGETPIENGAIIEGSMWGTELMICLSDYAAGTVNVTITPYAPLAQELIVGDNTISVTDTSYGNPVSFTAPEAGTYNITVGANTVLINNYSFYFNGEVVPVILAAGETISFNIATEDYSMSDVVLNISVAGEGGEEGGALALTDSYKYVPEVYSYRWVLKFSADGTGVLEEQEFANLSWGVLSSSEFTYTYDGTDAAIDFADGAPCADGTYQVGTYYIFKVMFNGAEVSFEIM